MPFALLKYGLSDDYPYEREPDIPAPRDLKSHYDVVIIGGGGHGVATAYYLAKYHGVTNVAILEKAYLGGGNTARNTAVIRSNYLTPEGVKFYSASVKRYEQLSNEFDFNIMYSQRGQLTLAHTDATVRAFRQRAEVNKHFGGRTELIDRQAIAELVPTLNLDPADLPVLAGLWHRDGATARHDAVAWGYAKGATQRGVELHQLTEVTDILKEGNKVTGVVTNRGRIQCNSVVQAVAGHSALLARKAGFELPLVAYPLQAMVTQPVKPFLNPLVSSSALHCYVQQTSRGEIVIGGGSDPYPPLQQPVLARTQREPDCPRDRDVSVYERDAPATPVGRHYRYDHGLQSDHGLESCRELLHRCGLGYLGLQSDPHLRLDHGRVSRQWRSGTRAHSTLCA